MKSVGNRGFTLIELMVVIAVIAILAAIAYPSFTEQVRQSRRADAFNIMGQAQMVLERHRADSPSYAGAPIPTGTDFYTLAASGETATGYTLTATPQGAQANDRCGNLELVYDRGQVTERTPTQARCWPGQ